MDCLGLINSEGLMFMCVWECIRPRTDTMKLIYRKNYEFHQTRQWRPTVWIVCCLAWQLVQLVCHQTNDPEIKSELFLHLRFIISAAIRPRLFCFQPLSLGIPASPRSPPEDPRSCFFPLDVSLPGKLGSCPGLLRARPPDMFEWVQIKHLCCYCWCKYFCPSVCASRLSSQRQANTPARTHTHKYLDFFSMDRYT